MEALVPYCSRPSIFHIPRASHAKTPFNKSNSSLAFKLIETSPISYFLRTPSTSKLVTCRSVLRPPSVSTANSTDLPKPVLEPEPVDNQEAPQQKSEDKEKFEWYGQWYPIMPACDLDKRVPHAHKIMGLDLVVWWDRNERAWKVFDDTCPHRKAPLSQGRIDQWGRLQCVYHGWCFNGSGSCKYIPQAPKEGPPVHTSKKACAAVYPSTLHQGIVWFWPNTDPKFKDIILEKQPPSIPELDDPSFGKKMVARDFPFGYEFLIENLMDPAHLPYAHYGVVGRDIQTIFRIKETDGNAQVNTGDREGGQPLEMSIKGLDKCGYLSNQSQGFGRFIAPCVYYSNTASSSDQADGDELPTEGKKVISTQRRAALIFYCIPVSPGNSRLIWVVPKNYGLGKFTPRWLFHLEQHMIVDSDLYLLHVQERRIKEIGPGNWEKACFVPTKSDVQVASFRRWLKKYAGGEVDWRGKYTGDLPPTPPREQLMDRYWSHTVICSSCNSAYKNLNAVEVILQVISIVSIGVVAVTKKGFMPTGARASMVIMAILCFIASKWLAHFVYKNFRYHDYSHALV